MEKTVDYDESILLNAKIQQSVVRNVTPTNVVQGEKKNVKWWLNKEETTFFADAAQNKEYG